MPRYVENEDVGVIEFPDSMTDAEINSAMNKIWGESQMKKAAKERPLAELAVKATEFAEDVAQAIADPLATKTLSRIAEGIAYDTMNLDPSIPNWQAAVSNAPLPALSDPETTLIEKGLADAAGTLPMLAQSAAIMMATGGTATPLQAAAAFAAPAMSAAHGETGDPIAAVKAGLVAGAIPGVAGAARQATARVLSEVVAKGWLAPGSTGVHKALEVIGTQGSLQVFMEGMNLPQYMSLGPEARQEMLTRNLIANAAFLSLDVPYLVRRTPSATQQMAPQEVKVAALVDQMVQNPDAMKALRQRVDDTVFDAAQPEPLPVEAAPVPEVKREPRAPVKFKGIKGKKPVFEMTEDAAGLKKGATLPVDEFADKGLPAPDNPILRFDFDSKARAKRINQFAGLREGDSITLEGRQTSLDSTYIATLAGDKALPDVPTDERFLVMVRRKSDEQIKDALWIRGNEHESVVRDLGQVYPDKDMRVSTIQVRPGVPNMGEQAYEGWIRGVGRQEQLAQELDVPDWVTSSAPPQAKKQAQAWDKDAYAGKKRVPQPVDELLPGDEFAIDGKPVKVREVRQDQHGAVGQVVVNGGKRFGVRYLSGRDVLAVDEGSLRLQPEGSLELKFEPKATKSLSKADETEFLNQVFRSNAKAVAAWEPGKTPLRDVLTHKGSRSPFGGWEAETDGIRVNREARDGGKVIPWERVERFLREDFKVATPENAEVLARSPSVRGGFIDKRIPDKKPKGKARKSGIVAMVEKFTLPRRIEAPALDAQNPPSIADIRKYLSKALDIPIRLGVGRRRALGFFRPWQETIRVKSLEDIPTIAHEVGHYLHFIAFPGRESMRFGPNRGQNVKKPTDFKEHFDSELLPLGNRTSRASYSKDQIRWEGVAEWTREYLTSREEALAKAPAFTTWMENTLAREFPEINTILQTARKQLKQYIEAEPLARLLTHIDFTGEPDKPTIREAWERRWNRFVDNWWNELQPIKRVAVMLQRLGLGAERAELPYELATNYVGGWRGRAEHAIYHEQRGFNGDAMGPGLQEILAPIRHERREFSGYLVGKRALELARRGKQTGIDARDAQWVVNEYGERYGEVASRLRQFLDNELQYLIDAGLVAPGEAALMREQNRDYIPFHRVYETVTGASHGSGRGFIDLPRPLRRLTGDTRRIIDPLESVIKNVYLYRDLAERNRVGTAFVDAVEAVRGGGRIAETIAKKIKPIKVSDEEARRFLGQIDGMIASELEAGVLPENYTGVGKLISDVLRDQDLGFRIWRMGQQSNAADGTFTVMRNGKEERWQLDDPDLYRALKLQDSVAAALSWKQPFRKVLSEIAGTLRAGATLTPEFAFGNISRDQFAATVYSSHGFIPFFDGFKGMFSVLGKDRWYREWVANGGRYSDFLAVDRKNINATVSDLMDPAWKSFYNRIAPKWMGGRDGSLWLPLQRMSEVLESASRVSAYRKAIKRGATPLQAANVAKAATLNFAKAGTKARALNSVSSFYNAIIRDLDKFLEAHRRAPVTTAFKGMAWLTVPSLLEYMLMHDDKRWNQLHPVRKHLAWNFNLGSMARELAKDLQEMPGAAEFVPPGVRQWLANQEGDWTFTFPKPLGLLGALYANAPVAALEYMKKKDPSVIRDWVSNVMESNPLPLTLEPNRFGWMPVLNIDVVPTALQTPMELAANYSFFRNAPIESERLQNLPKPMRAGPRTSEISRLFAHFMDQFTGGTVEVSPVKIDYTVKGYLAGIGQYGLDFADYVLVRKILKADVPEKAAAGIEAFPVLKRFVVSPFVPSKDVNRFYQGVTRMEQRYSGMKATSGTLVDGYSKSYWRREGEAGIYYLRPNGMLGGMPPRQVIGQITSHLGQLNRAMEMVQRNKEMSGDKKRNLLLKLTTMRNSLAEAGVNLFHPKDLK